jgi:hypothetical protein
MDKLTPRDAIVAMLEHLEAIPMSKVKGEMKELKEMFKPSMEELKGNTLTPSVAMSEILHHLEIIPKNRKLKDEIRDLKISFRNMK